MVGEVRALRSCFWWTIGLFAGICSLTPAQQAAAPAVPVKGKKVCVADIANSSMQPMFTDRVKQALVEALRNQNANVENAYTVTMLANRLALSGNNKIVFRREKCDFMLLSEVAKAAATSNTKTDDPSLSAPVPLSFEFALFKKGRSSSSVREGSIPVAASGDPTTAASAVVEKIASEVVTVLKSK